jgi:hypothetical protein
MRQRDFVSICAAPFVSRRAAKYDAISNAMAIAGIGHG